mgnify:CR=1 FL=1
MINHKFVGYHNQKEVVSFSGTNKVNAEIECENLLLSYFHNLVPGFTKMPLEYYNGVVAYVGEREEK